MYGRVLMLVGVLAGGALALPQSYGARSGQGKQLQPQPQVPMNYDFQWEVNNEEYQNFYGQQERADNGRVDGSYHVWLPDNRLMKVTYYVEGESGFVPTITFEDNYNPNWGTPYFGRR